MLVREAGPPEAPAVILVHGLAMTADLTWFGSLPVLGRHFRVLAMDLRGHGHGMPAGPTYSLEDCADDIVALADHVGVDEFIVVGHSMGGLVAQLVAHRHPERVAGLVLCSTARNFLGSLGERSTSFMLGAFVPLMGANPALHLVGANVVGGWVLDQVDDPGVRRWAEREIGRTSLATAAAAMHAAARFTSHDWIGAVDVPTAVLVTTRDNVVPAIRQRRLAAAIPGAVVHELDAGHGVCVSRPELFAETVVKACLALGLAAEPATGESA